MCSAREIERSECDSESDSEHEVTVGDACALLDRSKHEAMQNVALAVKEVLEDSTAPVITLVCCVCARQRDDAATTTSKLCFPFA